MKITSLIPSRPNARKLALIAGAATAVTAAATLPALAQDFSPVEAMLEKIVESLTGTAGTAIGTIAVAAVGISAFTGRMNWMFAISVLVGLVLLFGAATIIAGMGGA
jgi:type IV secretion system protein VirB2